MNFVPRQQDLWMLYIAQSIIGQEPGDYPNIGGKDIVRIELSHPQLSESHRTPQYTASITPIRRQISTVETRRTFSSLRIEVRHLTAV